MHYQMIISFNSQLQGIHRLCAVISENKWVFLSSVWLPDPSGRGEKGRGRKGLVNNYIPNADPCLHVPSALMKENANGSSRCESRAKFHVNV